MHIAYGTMVNDIKEVSKSYKEAKLALDVGKIFFSEKDIVCLYNSWNRQTDLSASASVVQDVLLRRFFEAKSPDDFDEETLTTINKFLREQPQCFRDIQTALHPQKYSGIQTG